MIDGSLNSQKIIHAMDEVMKKLRVRREHVNLLMSYASAYIYRAVIVLREISLKLLNDTCFAHLMHNCALKVKTFYNEADNLIAAAKASVIKNRSRTATVNIPGKKFLMETLFTCTPMLQNGGRESKC